MMEVVELLLPHLNVNIWHPVKLVMLRCGLCCKQQESRFAGSHVNAGCLPWLSRGSTRQASHWPAPIPFRGQC